MTAFTFSTQLCLITHILFVLITVCYMEDFTSIASLKGNFNQTLCHKYKTIFLNLTI